MKSKNSFRSVLYNVLLNNLFWLHKTRAFDFLWKRVSRPEFDFHTRLYGENVVIPSTYVFPLLVRAIPTFNNPYLELVYQTHLERKHKLNIIDIGASVGDTFLFIYKNIPEAIDKIICIEGDPRFFNYLNKNVKSIAAAICAQIVLSDKSEMIPQLIPTHSSSMTAQGEGVITGQSLDNVLPAFTDGKVDLIKIDVDGYDGKVLAGAQEIIRKDRPSIVFEFHPRLITATGNDLMLAFSVLEDCGYDILIWYDKSGVIVGKSETSDKTSIRKYINLGLTKTADDDVHFDVIALPKQTTIDTKELMNCTFAKNKRVKF